MSGIACRLRYCSYLSFIVMFSTSWMFSSSSSDIFSALDTSLTVKSSTSITTPAISLV